MKHLALLAYACLITIFLFTSCKKEKTTIPLQVSNNNKPPVAKAGGDISVTPLACGYRGVFAELDGSSSYSPDSNSISYKWRQISGPVSYIINYPDSSKTKLGNLTAGNYSFELTVTDAGGLFSKDTVLISVMKAAKEYDLDITYEGRYTFTDNVNVWDYGDYFDMIGINGHVTFDPFGDLQFYIEELDDTATLNNSGYNYIQISKGNTDPLYIQGNLSVMFKGLIDHGGGYFNSTIVITDGSARSCSPNLFNNLPPLSITGNLSVIGQLINFRIKGKVYF